MIDIVIQGIDLKNGKIGISESTVSVRISGHSLQASKGNDIVCAGVSALSQSVAMAFEYYAIAHSITQNTGFLQFVIDISTLDTMQRVRCESIISVFIIGISEIKRQYPEYITVKVND